MAAGVAKATSRTGFGLTMPPTEIAAGRRENEFLESPLVVLLFVLTNRQRRRKISVYEA